MAVFTAALLLIPHSSFSAQWQQQGELKLLYNQEGITVTVIPFIGKPAQAILHIQGTGTKLDGQSIATTLVSNGANTDYVNWNNKLVLRNAGSTPRKTLSLRVPGRGELTPVYFDKDGSASFDVADIVRQTLYRRSTGTNAQILLDEDQKRFDAVLSDANQICGASIKGEISANENADASNLDLGAACSDSVRAITNLCVDDIGKQAVQEQIKSVSCVNADEAKFAIQAGEFKVSVAPDTPAQAAKAYDWLENHLE